jgi:hypothetical protein
MTVLGPSKHVTTMPQRKRSTILICKCEYMKALRCRNLTRLIVNSYRETGHYKGFLDRPWGLARLNDTAYGIYGTVR